MSKMNLLRNATAASLAFIVFATSSFVALASPGTHSVMGELTVSGTAANGDAPFATINGEQAFSGRTVLSSTTIETPATTSATINLGKLGRVELSPGSNVVLNFSENGISAQLVSGKVRVSGADNTEAAIQTGDSTIVADKSGAKAFAVNFSDGATRVATEAGSVTMNGTNKTVKVNAGETKSSAQDTDDNDGDIFPGSVVTYVIIFGAAAAALVYIAARDSNEITVSGGTTVISPTR